MIPNLSDKLEKRFRRLREAPFASFHSSTRLFFSFYDQEEDLVQVSKKLAEKYPAMKSRLSHYLTNLSVQIDSVSETEAAAAAYGEAFLRKISTESLPPRELYNNIYERNIGYSENLRDQDANDARTLRAVKEQFLEPFCLYVTEQVGSTNEVILNTADWDPLVEMLRKEVFEKDIVSKTALTVQSNESLSLLFLDIDDFKNVNTDYGHPVGDKVIRCVSEKIRTVVGNRGCCYRNGGEEFCVLLHNHIPDEAVLLADRIRREISKEPISEEFLSITVSIGVASIPNNAQTSDELLQRANDAMRQAKELGKDRVVSIDGREITADTWTSVKSKRTLQKVLTAPRPDVRISISMAVTTGTAYVPSTVVSIRIENHSPVSVYITGLYFPTDSDKDLWIPKDVFGQSLIVEQELKPGKGITHLIDPAELKKFLHLNINNIVIRDAIGREYYGNEELVKRTLQAIL